MNLSVSKLQTLVILTFIAINFSQVAKAEDKYLDDPPQEKTWTIMNQCKSKLVSRAGGKIKVKHTLADWPKFNISDIPSDRAKRGGFYQNLIDQAFEKYSDQSSFVRCYNNAFNSALGKADNNDKEEASCKENIKEMDKDISEMIKLCGEANMGSSTAKCLDQARQCQSCDPNDPDDDDCDEDDVGTVEAYAGGIQQILNGGRTRQVTPNMATSMKKFSSCPALAGEDLDELQKEAEEMEKDRDDLTKQLHEMQEKANNLVDEQQDAETAVQAEIDQLDKDIKDEMQKIADDERSIDQGTKELFFEIENGIANAEREIRGLEIAKHDANIAFDEKMAEASARCHEAALEKLKRLNTEKQQLIQASLYSAGGFNDLMKSAGLSNKERMKKKVDDYYRECKLDRSFKDNQILLQKKLNSEKRKIDEQIRSQKEVIASLKKKRKEVEGSKLKQLQSMYEKLNNFKQEAEKQYTRLQEKLAKVKDKFARMQNNLTQQIALIQRQLQEKETYLQQKQAYLSLKQMYSTGMSTEKGAHAKAVGAISDASSSVDSVIESCKCADENESLSKTACKTACDFDSDFVKDRNASKCAPDTKKGSSHSDQKI